MVGLLSFGINPAATFQGNPNVTISAINTTGGIALTRSSGSTPMFVQVSASAITATGTSQPYEDLEYFWNFGDSSGTETFTDPNTGFSVNANNSQYGPEAAYVYRNTAGSPYTVTLTVRGKNGASFTTAQTTTSITVSAFNPSGGDWYFDSVNGLDTNNGTSLATPKQTWPTVQTAVSGITNNYRINLARGSSWSSTTGIDLSNTSAALTGLRIQAYGSGAAPSITVTGNTPAINDDNGGSSTSRPKTDVVISGLDIHSGTGWNSGSGVNGLVSIGPKSNASAFFTNYYLDNCTVTQLLTTPATTHNVIDFSSRFDIKTILNSGVWNCSAIGPASSAKTRMSFNYDGMDWGFVVGGTYSGEGQDALQDHHIYPIFQSHALFRYITLPPITTGFKCYAFNCDWNSLSGSPEITQYWLISDCFVNGPRQLHDASDGNNSTTQVLFQNFVVQRCSVSALPAAACSFSGGLSMTWRDCKWWNNLDSIWNPNGSAAALYKWYRNKIYVPSGAGSGAILDLLTGNAGSHPTYTTLQVITDNQVQDQRTASNTYNLLTFANQLGATIDRNDTYAPNDSDSKFFFNATTASSFAQWQTAGFDPNGSTTNPGFVNPAAGVF